ncbi:MAG: FHA domain-containing protein [Streptosporangiaceae bacterium]
MSEHAGNGHGAGGHASGLFPVPGDGVLARHGDLILLCSLEDSHAADDLLDLLEQVATVGGDGRQFADAIADVLEKADRGPSVLAFGPSASGLAITVSGGAWADISTAEGTARIEAGHPRMLLRGTVRSAVSGVRGGLSPGDNGAASTDRFSRLDAGTVRAGGLSYYSDAMATGRRSAAGTPPAQRPDVAPVHADQMTPPDVSGPVISGADISSAETSGMEVPETGADGTAAASAVLPAEAPEGAPQPQQTPFEPTEAWATPDPDSAQERQATELWSGPAAQPDQADAAAGNLEAMEPDVTAPPEPVSGVDPAQGEPFEAVVLLDAGSGSGVDVPARQPLSKVKDMPPGTSSYVSVGPIIQGVYCKNGHFDDPEALFCAICGISMNQQTLVPRPGERPPLGVLLLDDGAVFQLDSDYVIGREPSLDGSVAQGKARPLRIGDDTGIVSRVHARIHLDGWRVLVTDLASANGTRVLLPGQPAEHALVPQVPIVLATGSQVDLGGRAFRYESHRGR